MTNPPQIFLCSDCQHTSESHQSGYGWGHCIGAGTAGCTCQVYRVDTLGLAVTYPTQQLMPFASSFSVAHNLGPWPGSEVRPVRIRRMIGSARRVLKKHGKKPSDVLWVGMHDGSFRISWAEFEKQFSPKIFIGAAPSRMVIAGDGWWLETFKANNLNMDLPWAIGVVEWRFLSPPTYNPDAKPFVPALLGSLEFTLGIK